LILLHVVNLLLQMDSATSVSYIMWKFYPSNPILIFVCILQLISTDLIELESDN